MLPIKYTSKNLEKMKSIPGTFMWIKENENKVDHYKKQIYIDALKSRRK
jgi:hypothetical protein